MGSVDFNAIVNQHAASQLRVSELVTPVDDDGVCADCEDALEETPVCLVEALETFGETLCDTCFEARCEAAWERQQEDAMSEPPMTLAEQHRAAWDQKQELRR